MSSRPRIEELWAHTPNDNGEPQLLRCHLLQVAELAERFASAFNAGELGRITGLLHDVGKASNAFQSYLRDCEAARQTGRPLPRTSTDHKLAGIRYALSLGGIAGIVALPILGHHGGLLDPSNVRNALCSCENNEDVNKAIQRCGILGIGELPTTAVIPSFASEQLACETFIRMLYSALVDADFLNTENHWQPDRERLRQPTASLNELWELFEANQRRLQSEADPSLAVNQVRNEVYEACVAAADNPPGVYRLTVPTGGGKTRSAMAFALKHAIKHNLDRVIVAIPYTSIIDQNVRVYREIFGYANILEHHSSVQFDENNGYSEETQRLLLASENWDFPIIVTTTVQLFESLFHNKPSRCRKLHNIARSVIILDEVQTLPVELVRPILDILQELVANYGVTVVLSTATQPAFSGESPYLRGFSPEPTEIVPDPANHFERLRRVDYEIAPEQWSWERVAEEMGECSQVMCVVNTRNDALHLYELLQDSDTFHLSTLMCPAHRREVLEEIRRRLASGEPCRICSTQVVEAGVDLDFPVVFRAMGPLDRIVQAAGRCNREGRMSSGRVVVFDPMGGGAPRGSYATAIAEARRLLGEDRLNLHDPNVFERYFSLLWQDCNTDAYRIQELRTRMNYPEVANRFRLIRDDTVPVIVNYGNPGPTPVLERIRSNGTISMEDWRTLQSYSVSLYSRDLDRYRSENLIEEVIQGLYLWIGTYDERTGISPEITDPADLIV